MTFIHFCKIGNSTMLMGDLLISFHDGENEPPPDRRSPRMPCQYIGQQIVTNPSVVGLKQKAVILNDNAALAWCGAVPTADHFQEMRERFQPPYHDLDFIAAMSSVSFPEDTSYILWCRDPNDANGAQEYVYKNDVNDSMFIEKGQDFCHISAGSGRDHFFLNPCAR